MKRISMLLAVLIASFAMMLAAGQQGAKDDIKDGQARDIRPSLPKWKFQ